MRRMRCADWTDGRFAGAEPVWNCPPESMLGPAVVVAEVVEAVVVEDSEDATEAAVVVGTISATSAADGGISLATVAKGRPGSDAGKRNSHLQFAISIFHSLSLPKTSCFL